MPEDTGRRVRNHRGEEMEALYQKHINFWNNPAFDLEEKTRSFREEIDRPSKGEVRTNVPFKRINRYPQWLRRL